MVDMDKIKEDVVKGNYFPQGGEVRYAYTMPPHVAVMHMKHIDPALRPIAITFIKHGILFCGWDIDDSKTAARHLLEKQKKDKAFIDDVEKGWKSSFDEMKKLAENIIDMDLDLKPIEELIKIFKEISEKGLEQWTHLIFLDTFDKEGDIIMEEELTKTPELLDKVGLLTYADMMSYSQQEGLKILKIALKAADNEDINTMIEAHQHKYYWYQNNYAHIIFLEKKDFIAEVDEILKLKTADEIRQEIKKIEDNIHDKCNERDKLKSSLTDDTQNILYFFQKMAGLRDDRKKAHCIMLTSMRRVLEAIAKKVDIDIELLEYIAYWEADEILDDKEKFLNKLKDREKGVFSISYRNEGFYIIGGDEANAINDAIQSKILGDKTEIVGKSASTGKVQGIVKIINRVADFSNLNRGDILVSCMTRPEFVPIMEKAAAIVTDEGGITCHAAIVSRELGIPCIVGTDIATKLLKDGDLVEVDADKGIVKKI